MKKLAFYLLIALFVTPVVTEAKVWRVNNNVGVVADFNNISTALYGVALMDTIYLEPSATEYILSSNNDFFYQNKNLTIIGSGYFLAANQNGNGGLQQDALESIISTNTSGATGLIHMKGPVKFIGIVFDTRIYLGNSPSFDPVSNLSFESCLLKYNIFSNITPFTVVSNLHFSKNYMLGDFSITQNQQQLLNFTFENNILVGNFTLPITITQDQRLIRNNVFGGTATFNAAYCANNIFRTSAALTFPGCILKNNIFQAAQSATSANVEANNQWAAEMSNVFQSTQTDRDKYFQLAPGSQAIGAGVPNGTAAVDCGAFGGPDPYKLSGIPAIPTIYLLQMPSSIISNTNTLIDLKSRSNN